MGNRWIAVLDRWLHEVVGLWTIFLYWLGCMRLVHLGCSNKGGSNSD